MKINGIDNSLIFPTIQNSIYYQKNSVTQNGTSVQVTISKEGREYYRKRIQELTRDSESYDEMRKKKDNLVEANLTASDVDYNFIFGEKLGSYKKPGEYPTVKEQADTLLKTYGTLYDEIVQGYENGTREIHVEDDTSEKGYRILTQEEEINDLNASYKVYANAFEEDIKQELQVFKDLEKYTKQLERIYQKKGTQNTSMLQKHVEYLNRRKNEVVPDNVSKNLFKAALTFRENYMGMKSGKRNLMTLLDSIKIF